MCCHSSGVERTLGKGEVESSILSGSTILYFFIFTTISFSACYDDDHAEQAAYLKILLAILLTIAMFMGATAYAANRSCIPTQDMSANMFAEQLGFTATFILGDEDRGFVMQVFTGPKGFKITRVKNWGRTSCVLLSGPEWQWANPAWQ